jgi:hypothetical protein
MRFVTFILVNTFLHCVCNGQNTFNKRLHFNFPAAILTSVVPTDSCYYATGLIADSLPPFYPGNVFLKFDLEGNQELLKVLKSPNKTYETWFNTLTPLDNGEFIVSGFTFDSLSKALLIKYNNIGDTIFTKAYSNPFSPAQDFIHPRDMKTCPDGGFVFAAHIAGMPNGPYQNADFWIVKTDSLGNVEWDKIIGNNYWDRPFSIAVDDQGNVVVGGHKANINLVTQNYTFQTYLTQLDSLGNIQWSYLTPTSVGLRDAANDMILLEDGSLVIASGVGWEQERSSVNVVYFDKLIYKINPLHEIEWETSFKELELTGTAMTSNLIKVTDGSGYIIAGTDGEDLPGQNTFTIRGWIGKVSLNGDSIWTRKFIGIDNNNNRHQIYDLKETPDGGFILCGESKNPDADSIPQQAWLLKLDPYGCLVPGCHLIDATEETKPEIKLAIYPNPTSDYLNFYLRTPVPVREASFRIVNAAGAVVREFKNDMPGATYMVPVWEWAAGIYFLQYLENGLVRCSEQFVKH